MATLAPGQDTANNYVYVKNDSVKDIDVVLQVMQDLAHTLQTIEDGFASITLNVNPAECLKWQVSFGDRAVVMYWNLDKPPQPAATTSCRSELYQWNNNEDAKKFAINYSWSDTSSSKQKMVNGGLKMYSAPNVAADGYTVPMYNIPWTNMNGEQRMNNFAYQQMEKSDCVSQDIIPYLSTSFPIQVYVDAKKVVEPLKESEKKRLQPKTSKKNVESEATFKDPNQYLVVVKGGNGEYREKPSVSRRLTRNSSGMRTSTSSTVTPYTKKGDCTELMNTESHKVASKEVNDSGDVQGISDKGTTCESDRANDLNASGSAVSKLSKTGSETFYGPGWYSDYIDKDIKSTNSGSKQKDEDPLVDKNKGENEGDNGGDVLPLLPEVEESPTANDSDDNSKAKSKPVASSKTPKKSKNNRTRSRARRYACKYCDKWFANYCNKLCHERVHTGEKPYACQYCGKLFSHDSNKIKHERIHTGEKPYTCCYCSKSFSQIHMKLRHEQIHRGERPYTCSYCQKRFTQDNNRKQHERIHTGERPFSCTYCNKKFAYAYGKRLHERTHTGEKPFSCCYCDRKFRSSSQKDVHQLIHTGEKPIPCRYCKKSFRNKSNRKRHEETHKKQGDELEVSS